jgi:hypothetical protein
MWMGRMSESISELHKAIESRCERVRNALDDCPKAGLLFFYQVIRIILTASRGAKSEQELRALLLQLDEVVQTLQFTKDANGEEVLSFRRWEKFMRI